MVKQGDIIFVNFAPTIGREQTGERPALVISTTKYNIRSGFVLVCPITSTVRRMNIRIPLDSNTNTKGDILCEQIRLLDLRERTYRVVEAVSKDKLRDVYNVVKAISKNLIFSRNFCEEIKFLLKISLQISGF